MTFQSAPPARGATVRFRLTFPAGFNPRPPRGGRLHRVRAESFNPRPPRGGRHRVAESTTIVRRFNPRPPRGGRPSGPPPCASVKGFNPRPPRGGRQRRAIAMWTGDLFQSAPPARGATVIRVVQLDAVTLVFQSAPPARGATTAHADVQVASFQSAPPARGATSAPWQVGTVRVSIRAPRAGGDLLERDWVHAQDVSIRAPRAGGDGASSPRLVPGQAGFNPRPPRGGRPS